MHACGRWVKYTDSATADISQGRSELIEQLIAAGLWWHRWWIRHASAVRQPTPRSDGARVAVHQ